ncbi:hypothetical protein PQQ51_27070 [Paraburkholderia xenovorans]|uniref:hypothetical protein n=1 Tax=Paraburkholderia xenovorans TaxID=36873 RepID=UPI0038B77B3E
MLWLMRHVRLASFAVLFGLAPAAPVFADAAPQLLVRAHLEPAGPVVAGSEVKLVVDLLTTTWFTEAPNWPLFTVPDAIVSLPDEQADNLSEEIDGVHWFGVSRAYRIAPQAGKTYRIAPFAITVYPGGANAPAQVMTPALTLVATLPPGAEGMATFFATSALTVTQNIEPSSAHLKVGESITRTIVQRAAGTEAMLIPPASLGDVEGLKRYAKPPTTRNIVQDRVGLVAGERTDSVTYSADRDGRFKLPPVSVEWWNTKTQKKETAVLPGVTFSASKAREKPLFEIPADAMSQGFPHRIVVIHSREVLLGCALVLAVGVLLWARSRITTFVRGTRARAREARRRYRESAAMAWRKLRAVARNGELRGMVPALYRWMDRTGDFGRPARLENLTQSDDAAAAQLALAVNAHYAGGAALPLNWAATARALRRMQRKAKSRRRATRPLPPLNDY